MNQPPTVAVGPNQAVRAFEQGSVTAVANDGDGTIESYTWSATGGVTLNPSGATVTFTPPPSMAEQTYTITCEVKDNAEATATDSMTVTVPIWPEWVLGTPHRAVREQTLGTLTLEPLLTETGASLLTETGDTLHA